MRGRVRRDRPRLNPGLVTDCSILLDSMDTLAGAAALDWTATSAISTWEGIDLNASSTRVTLLDLDDEDLDGTIPPALGGLSALVTLDLSDNDLTGEIPEELGRLWSLETLRLSGNMLTAASHCAEERNYQRPEFAQPPVLRASGAPEPERRHTWPEQHRPELGHGVQRQQVPGGVPQRHCHRVDSRRRHDLRHDPHGGRVRVRDHIQLPGARVRQRRHLCDGVERAVGHGDRNDERVPGPEFSLSSYDFSVSEDTSIGQSVGRVSATDPDEADTVTYSITAGNELGDFAIDTLTAGSRRPTTWTTRPSRPTR